MLHTFLASLLLVWMAIYLIYSLRYLKKGKGDPSITLYPFVLVIRTKKFIDLMDKLAKSKPILWDVISRIAITSAIGMAGFAIYFLINNLYTFIARPQEVGVQNIVVPIVPGLTVSLENIPYLLFAIALVLITHEGMHGIIARKEGYMIRSTGVFLLAVIPGGFVEPDEQEFRSSHPSKRMRVAAVGSFINLITGLMAIAVMWGIFLPVETGVLVTKVSEDSLLPQGELLVAVNGIEINRANLGKEVNLEGNVVIKGIKGDYVVRLKEKFNGNLIDFLRSLGIDRMELHFPFRFFALDPIVERSIFNLLWWLQIVAIGVAVINILPILPLDGGIMLRAFVEMLTSDQRKVKAISVASSIVCAGLIMMNFLMTYITFGFFQI